MQLVQRVQMETLDHHLFFCTLTYQNSTIPRLTTSTGYEFRYADFHDVVNMMKRIRKNNLFTRPFKYFAVSERGSLYGRPHFHLIFMLDKLLDDNFLTITQLEGHLFKVVLSEWKRNIAVTIKNGKSRPNTRNPKYVPLCQYVEKWENGVLTKTFDLHYINPRLGDDSGASVAFYVLKYMMKSSDKETRLQQALRLNLPEDEYEDVWKLVRSRYNCSKDFGSSKSEKVQEYLKDCIKVSTNDEDMQYPIFINPDSGQTFPLARFYKDKGSIYSINDASVFYFRQDAKTIDTIVDLDEDFRRREQDYQSKMSKYEKNKKLLDTPTLYDSAFESDL